MATVDFIPFATAVDANVADQSVYAAAPTTSTGYLDGPADATLCNKAWRQGAFMASVLANWISETLIEDVLDDGDLSSHVTQLNNAVVGSVTTPANMSAALSPNNATITMEPTGTGTLVIAPVTTEGSISNMAITVKAGTHFQIVDPTDPTKIASFVCSGISTGTTRNFTLPNSNGTFATLAGTETFTNKTFDTAAATGNILKINGTTVSDKTGTGKFVLDTSPTLTTPTLGVATATTINKVTITQPATGSTLTVDNGKTLRASASLTFAGVDGKTLTVSNNIGLAGTDGKTLTLSNNLIFTGTDDSSVAFGAGGTVGYLGTAQTWTKQNVFDAASTIASSANAVLDDVSVPADTTTVTGSTHITTTTGFNKVSIYQPTITGSSAATIDFAATLYIDNSPAIAGSVTIANAYALWVRAGAVRFGGSFRIDSAASFADSGVWGSGGIVNTSLDLTNKFSGWGRNTTDRTFSSTTPADVTGLSVTLVSGGHYIVDFGVPMAADATSGYKLVLGGTVTATSLYGLSFVIDPASNTMQDSHGLAATGANLANAAGAPLPRLMGWLEIDVNVGGTLTIQAGVKTGSTAMTVKQGSWIRAFQVP